MHKKMSMRGFAVWDKKGNKIGQYVTSASTLKWKLTPLQQVHLQDSDELKVAAALHVICWHFVGPALLPWHIWALADENSTANSAKAHMKRILKRMREFDLWFFVNGDCGLLNELYINVVLVKVCRKYHPIHVSEVHINSIHIGPAVSRWVRFDNFHKRIVAYWKQFDSLPSVLNESQSTSVLKNADTKFSVAIQKHAKR